jgi:hypothetical protein
MKNLAFMLVVLAVAALGFGVAIGLSGNPPGRDPCSHGETGKPCRDDPQPGHGKDCDEHGKHGGVNEDHCRPPTTTTQTTETTGTTTTQTTTTTGTTTTQTTTSSPPCIPRNPDGSLGGKDGKPGNDDCAADTTTTGTTTSSPTTPTTTAQGTTTESTTAETTTTPAPSSPPPASSPPVHAKPHAPHARPHGRPHAPPLCPVGKPSAGRCAVQGSG